MIRYNRMALSPSFNPQAGAILSFIQYSIFDLYCISNLVRFYLQLD
jgi:hypothetical protein